MEPNEWLVELHRIVTNSEWDDLTVLRKKTNESFSRDFQKLKSFYFCAVDIGLSSDKGLVFKSTDLQDFLSKIKASLIVVANKIATNSAIKAVYFEYYFDGHKDESNAGNFFLCESFSDGDDSWGSDFGEEGFVEGALLPDFFFFDVGWEWDENSRHVAEEAANGLLLALLIEEWELSGIKGIPLGFANHDHEMVRIQP